jgi:hypothetical protein
MELGYHKLSKDDNYYPITINRRTEAKGRFSLGERTHWLINIVLAKNVLFIQ